MAIIFFTASSYLITEIINKVANHKKGNQLQIIAILSVVTIYLIYKMAKKKIKITQIKSRIGYSKKAKATLDALGLRKLNQSITVDLNDAIHGMIKKIDYLIKVEEVK